jgi:hypothetical protein
LDGTLEQLVLDAHELAGDGECQDDGALALEWFAIGALGACSWVCNLI